MPILKLMDDREVVEQYVEVLLDQETHAETPEHRSPSTTCSPEILYSLDLGLSAMNSGGLMWLDLDFD